jgi:hypothetical protein
VDPGVPYEHDRDPELEVAKPAQKSAAEVALENIQAELVRERKARETAEEDARFWANRGRQQPVEREEIPRPEPKAARVAPKPEKFLDDLASEGLDGARKNGLLTVEDAQAMIDKAKAEVGQTIQETRADAEFGATFAREFPEITADVQRVSNGQKASSAEYVAAARIIKELGAEYPDLKGTNSLVLMAARQARVEVAAAKKQAPREAPLEDDQDRQSGRRRRIDAQRGERSAASSEGDGGHADGFSKEQLTVMKHLNVKPEVFRKNLEETQRRAR